MKDTNKVNFGAAVVLTLIGKMFFSEAVFVGLSLGALLMTLNLAALLFLAKRMVEGQTAHSAVAAILLVGKFGFLLLCTWVATQYLGADIVAFAFGAGLIVFSMAIASALGSRKLSIVESS